MKSYASALIIGMFAVAAGLVGSGEPLDNVNTASELQEGAGCAVPLVEAAPAVDTSPAMPFLAQEHESYSPQQCAYIGPDFLSRNALLIEEGLGSFQLYADLISGHESEGMYPPVSGIEICPDVSLPPQLLGIGADEDLPYLLEA